MAESAVNTLLGNLTTILGDETRLVRSVHSEVQFIKDEMESMYGFLLHVEAEQHADGGTPPPSEHQVNAWTKQVKELAYGSQECVDKYVTSVVVARPSGGGLLSRILKMPIYVLKTLPARRRIASQIRDLRVRVQEVGERRLRYGVEIPRAAATASKQPEQPSGACDGEGDGGNNQLVEDERRTKLVSVIPTDIKVPSPFHSKENISRVSHQLVRGAQAAKFHSQHLQRQGLSLYYDEVFSVFCTLYSQVMCVHDLAREIIYSVKEVEHSGDSLKDRVRPVRSVNGGVRPVKNRAHLMDPVNHETHPVDSMKDRMPPVDQANHETHPVDSVKDRMPHVKNGVHTVDPMNHKTHPVDSMADGMPPVKNGVHPVDPVNHEIHLMDSVKDGVPPVGSVEDGVPPVDSMKKEELPVKNMVPFVKEWFHCITYVSVEDIWDQDFHPYDIVEGRIGKLKWCRECSKGGFTHLRERDCTNAGKTLVFVEGIVDDGLWSWLLRALRCYFGCAEGSAIVLMAPGNSLGFPVYPGLELIQPNPLIPGYLEKASVLLQDYDSKMDNLLTNILGRLCPPDFHNGWGLKMFLHFLYAKPTCTSEELWRLHDELTPQFTYDNIWRVVMACFDELPSHHYKSCLMYLTTFQHSQSTYDLQLKVEKETPIRRERAARQWVFHGLLSDKDVTSAVALQEADRCFEALLNRGFISPKEISIHGKVKTFVTPNRIMKILLSLRSAPGEGDSSYAKWRHHDEIREHTKKQEVMNDTDSGFFRADAPWINLHRNKDPFLTNELIEGLLKSARIGGVEVLDLQGCKGLKKRHLRGICATMILLKYLSIRDTDVEELPSGIQNLKYLEMLDIRQTKLRAFINNVIKVKRLKHLLVGNTDSNRLVSTLILPSGIGSMSMLEVLSHVQLPKNKSEGVLNEIKALRLRKLGVLLQANKADYEQLLKVIRDMYNTLQSLSIRVEDPCDFAEVTQVALFKAPVNLQSLTIHGIKNELPTWIKELHQLQKVTLQNTYLQEKAFKVLGELPGLRKLRIHESSFEDSRDILEFSEGQFKSLEFLLIECPKIKRITFTTGAAPEAQNIVWSFKEVQTILGVGHLPVMKKLLLKGKWENVKASTKNYIHKFADIIVFEEVRA